MKGYKNVVSKVITLALAICFTMLTSVMAFADGTTINFIYDNPDFENYKIDVWEDADPHQTYAFEKNGTGAILVYNVKNTEAEVVSFYINSTVEGNVGEGYHTRTVEIPEEGGIIDVKIQPGVDEIQTEAGTEYVPVAEEETTVAPAADNAETTAAPAAEGPTQPKEDDPNGDYSVGAVTVIIVDILLIAVIAAVSYAINNKKNK